MSIYYHNEDLPFPKLKRRESTKWIKEVVSLESRLVGEISFVFCSDSYLLEVNRKYLNHDYFTDIITFDYVSDNVITGDIFISVDRVLENSKQFESSFDMELRRVMVHGILHLVGYKDKTSEEKKLMTAKEDFYLNLF